MKNQKSSNIKLGIFVLAFIIGGIIFWINRQMVIQLRLDAQNQITYLAKAYTKAINSSNESELQFVLDVVLPSLNFPIVITTNKEIYATINLEVPFDEGSSEYNDAIWEIIHRMDDDFTPLKIVWGDLEVQDLHFGNPEIVGRMRWLPVMELCLIFLFILISLWGIQLIRKNEENSIYVGMARETAHQLGTPISSLMGWFKLLEENPNQKCQIIDSIDEDIARLSEISDRFAKIGSNPKMKRINIFDLLHNVSKYISLRISDRSNIKIKVNSDNLNIFIDADETLLFWAFENLIKNSVDAIKLGKGEIIIKLDLINEHQVKIDLNDTGKGILRKDKRKIFRPGFSSKDRGWGLGLSLTKRIIEEIHDGKIILLKSQPGETIFRIFFNHKK